MYTSNDVLLVRRYQAVCCVNTYIQHYCKQVTYGAATSCDTRKFIYLTQLLDMVLRYNNPQNSTQETLNCLSEKEMDNVFSQISKLTGCKFYGKDTDWQTQADSVDTPIPWEWNLPAGTDILWNDGNPILTNGFE